jgi:hypothetical protein
MKPVIRVLGGGAAGSWQIRGVQLGHAIGAQVMEAGTITDGADIVIAVKRWPLRHDFGRRRGFMLVWDLVDAWPQPAGNTWDRGAAMVWLREALQRIRPDLVLGATAAMVQDVQELGYPAVWVPHHHRPGIERNPIQAEFRVIGYEGAPHYLDGWLNGIVDAARALNLTFMVNPLSLAHVDAVLALRTDTGYPAIRWKSGVKLANAQGSGTPFVGCVEAGYVEIATGAEIFVEQPQDLLQALGRLGPQKVRQEIGQTLFDNRISVEFVADQLTKQLEVAHARWR